MAPLVSYIELGEEVPKPARGARLREVWHVGVTAAFCFGAFGVDMLADGMISASLLYAPLLFCGKWFMQRKAVFGLAAIASVMVAVGLMVSTPIPSIQAIRIFNRVLSVISLWVLAVVLYEQRQAEDELRGEQLKYKNAIDSFGAGIWEWPDVSKPLVHWSDVYYAMMGYKRGEMPPDVDWVMDKQFHPDDKGRAQDAIAGQLDRGERFKLEARLLTKDNGYRWFSWSGDVVAHDDGARGMVGSIIDIHERKLAEDQVKAAADKLAEQNMELTRSNQELENFAYITSHDLNEPLRMVRSYCELLQEKFGEKLGAEGKEFIGFAVDGATRMQMLIRDVLSYSRVSRNEMKMETVDLRMVVDDVKKLLGPSLEEVEAKVEVENGLPVVVGERNMLGQVMQNLLTNAVKFRKPEEPLRVKIKAAKEGSVWRVSVADNGIGLDNKFKDKIFEMFKRLHSREKYEGTGIGLAVCKKVVERHGGEITVDSTPGLGAVFSFTLPDRNPTQGNQDESA